MTDQELLQSLRSGRNSRYDDDDTADRIEELVATNEALTEQLTAAQQDAKEAEAYAEELEEELNTCRMAQAVMDNTVSDLEAKLSKTEGLLAKAVEALELIVVDSIWGLEHQTYMKCRKASAAIKGESHE